MIELSNDDMRRIIGFMPKDIIKLMRVYPIYLAGGYIRARIAGEDVSDIDLFAPTKEQCEIYADTLSGARGVTPYKTKNAFTIISPPRLPVQFIHRWTYNDPCDLLNSFDFTIARACIWFDRSAEAWRSMAADTFYMDLAPRRLRYCQPSRSEDAGGSLLRVQKFLKRGYDISPEEFGKVLARLIDKVEPGSEFWKESESSKARILTGFLRQVDPLAVIDGLAPADDCLEAPPAPQFVQFS